MSQERPSSVDTRAYEAGVATVTKVTEPYGREPAAEESVVGQRLGRYEVLDPIGAGGMGHVHRAHDPRLGRDVAIKLIRRASQEGLQRMRREAKAMAQLSHPNVLPVYDVGEHRGRLYIAMELVEGQTLREWLRAQPRSWPEIRAYFLAAGAGLRAAHEAGLVHRDFNPSNVLIGRDGRARVMDFGLARVAVEWASSEASVDEGPRSGGAPSTGSGGTSGIDEITAVGYAVGTPAYMAPEQHRGETVGAAADQYAFCVSLWEAVAGQRPFDAHGHHRLAVQKHKGPPPSPPSLVALPRRIERAVQQGLSPEPEDRLPSMDALLSVLQPRQRWSRPRRMATAAAAAGVVLAAGHQLLAGAPLDPCDRGHERLAGIWDGPAKEEAEAAIMATGRLYAAEAWMSIEPRLDDYASRWEVGHRGICEATRAGAQDDAQLQARRRCLEHLRQDFGALVRTVAEVDATGLGRAVDGASRLSPPSRCDDPQWLSHDAPPPEDAGLRAKVDALRERLAWLRARRVAGQLDDLVVDAWGLVGEAIALDYAPVVVEARLELGRGLMTQRDPQAQEVLEKAFFDAGAQGMDTAAAEAAIAMVRLTASQLAQPEDAERWSEHARVAVERLEDQRLLAHYHQAVGIALSRKGDHPGAVQRHEQSWALLEQHYGPDDTRVAVARSRVANGLLEQGRVVEAREHLAAAIEIYEQAFGDRHPTIAAFLHSMGHALRLDGDRAGARASFERALSIHEAVYGDRHPEVASSLNNLGMLAHDEKRDDEAIALWERALKIRREVQGPTHPQTAKSLLNLAVAFRAQGKLDEASRNLGEVKTIYEDLYGPRHPMMAKVLNNLGNLEEQRGDLPEAVRLHGEALALYEEVKGLQHVDTLKSRVNLERVEGKLAESSR